MPLKCNAMLKYLSFLQFDFVELVPTMISPGVFVCHAHLFAEKVVVDRTQ